MDGEARCLREADGTTFADSYRRKQRGEGRPARSIARSPAGRPEARRSGAGGANVGGLGALPDGDGTSPDRRASGEAARSPRRLGWSSRRAVANFRGAATHRRLEPPPRAQVTQPSIGLADLCFL